MQWYDRITSFVLDYISVSIKDSDVSNFYRYIISLKNLLRATEYTGKAGIYGIRYLSSRLLGRVRFQEFVKSETLRREYLNQTFNFMPELEAPYGQSRFAVRFDRFQDAIIQSRYTNADGDIYSDGKLIDILGDQLNLSRISQLPSSTTRTTTTMPLSDATDAALNVTTMTTTTTTTSTTTTTVTTTAADLLSHDNGYGLTTPQTVAINYFTTMLLYSKHTKALINSVAKDIEKFVIKELTVIRLSLNAPIILVIIISLMVPLILYITFKATSTMYR